MTESHDIGFAERLKTSSAAKSALLAKFRPRPMVADPSYTPRAARRAAELDRVRAERAEAKAAAKRAVAEAEEAARQAQAALAAEALDAKRGERKERKALTKVEAKAKRDARYAARQARR
jgi:hypothetical protein